MPTNYERYFGTPEKVADIVSELLHSCEDCFIPYGACLKKDKWFCEKSMKAWLESEADDADN